METPIQKILIYLQENMNGVGIIMNESGLSAREKTYYTAVNDSLKTTKEYVESFLNDEEELLRQNREMKEALENAKNWFEQGYESSGKPEEYHKIMDCLTSCNKGNK